MYIDDELSVATGASCAQSTVLHAVFWILCFKLHAATDPAIKDAHKIHSPALHFFSLEILPANRSPP